MRACCCHGTLHRATTCSPTAMSLTALTPAPSIPVSNCFTGPALVMPAMPAMPCPTVQLPSHPQLYVLPSPQPHRPPCPNSNPRPRCCTPSAALATLSPPSVPQPQPPPASLAPTCSPGPRHCGLQGQARGVGCAAGPHHGGCVALELGCGGRQLRGPVYQSAVHLKSGMRCPSEDNLPAPLCPAYARVLSI